MHTYRPAEHGVRFARAGLAVRQEAAVVAAQDILQKWPAHRRVHLPMASPNDSSEHVVSLKHRFFVAMTLKQAIWQQVHRV